MPEKNRDRISQLALLVTRSNLKLVEDRVYPFEAKVAENILEIHRHIKEGPTNNDAIFFIAVMPQIVAFINLSVDQSSLIKVIELVRNELGEKVISDAIVHVLTLSLLAHRAYHRAQSKSLVEGKAWEEILKRLENLHL